MSDDTSTREIDRSSLSRAEFNELLTFDAEMQGYPCTADLILRDDADVLVYASRRKNADSEWTIRSYRVLADRVEFTTEDLDRATLAATLVEEFEPDALTTDERYVNQRPVRHGVPVAVAVAGKPAVCAWLYVRGESREAIAELMGVGRPTVGEYLSRFRRRGSGIPDDPDVPEVGEIVREVPPEFDPVADSRRIVADGGSDCVNPEDVRHRDRIDVIRDGEEIEVFNWINVLQPAVIRGGNPVVEKFEAEIGAGDSDRTPDAITEWVAEELDWEFGIDPEDHDIEVVDIESEEVDLL